MQQIIPDEAPTRGTPCKKYQQKYRKSVEPLSTIANFKVQESKQVGRKRENQDKRKCTHIHQTGAGGEGREGKEIL